MIPWENTLRDKGREQGTGRSLRTLSTEQKGSLFSGVRNQEEKARDQHG